MKRTQVMKIVLFSAIAALVLLTGLPASGAERARVVLKKLSPTDVNGNGVFLLGTGDNYAINCQKGDQCMSMGGPVGTGWYCGGFFNFALNGREAGTSEVGRMFESEQGRRAILDSVWHMEAADVRVRFLGLPGRDFLFCEMTVDPQQEIKSLSLTTLCYPAYFTSYYGQREEARYLQTPSELIRQAEGRTNIRLVPKDNWWLLYGDDYFDVAKTKESEGPCAMMVLPEDVASITVGGLGYGVVTTVSISPQTRKIRMAFWKMKGRTNAEAIAYFRKNGEAVRKELATLDFMPENVRTFDLPGTTAELERFARSETAGAGFQKKAADILAWIKAESAGLTAKGDGVNATERKLELLKKCAGFVYEARLAEMLTSLEKN